MPRRTHRRNRRQHHKGVKRPRGWHRDWRSKGVAETNAWLAREGRA